MRSLILVALSGSVGAMVGSEDAWWSMVLFLVVGLLSLIWAARGSQRPVQRPLRPERCNVVPVRTYDWSRQPGNPSPTSVHGSILGQGISDPQAARKAAGRGGVSR